MTMFGKQTEDEQKARKRIVELAYLSVFLLTLLILLFQLPNMIDAPTPVIYIAEALTGVAGLISFIFSRRGIPIVGAYMVSLGMWLMTVTFIFMFGLANQVSIGFITAMLIASVTVGLRGVTIFTVLSIISIIGLYFAQMNGMLAAEPNLDIVVPIAISVHVFGGGLILSSLIRTFNKNLYRALENERLQLEANKELRQLQVDLEQRVTNRTRDLQIASNVSRQITQVLELEKLLPHLVEQTKEGFGLYSVSVFLYESKSRNLILEAGTGDAGRQMKAEGKKFSIEATPSIVAQAGREHQAIVIEDVSQSGKHFINPHLPDTKSEAAIPMVLHGELIGVLDLQSDAVDKFGEADLQILTTLAEQIVVAIENARLYQEQVHLTEELRTVDKMKSQFLSSMSHELRTPLNAIINFTEMVTLGMVGPVTDDQKELLGHSLKSSTHLLHLINDVLDISKIQAGRLSLFVEQDVDLYQELETAIEMVKPSFGEKPVKLVLDIDDNLPIISGDKRRIRQVMLNLLSNAIKFTNEGSVTVSAKYQVDRVMFAVIDTGEGIAPEAQVVIFEPFVQTVDGGKLEQGTGLGLSISRSLVQAHGGELWVESQIRQGAAFYFTLPALAKQ